MGDQGDTRDRVLVEVAIAAPADEVWDAIRDPAKIYNWFGWDAAGLKDEIDFIFDKYGKADAGSRTLRFEGTQDRFEVEARGEGSVLRVVRAEPAGARWDDVYEDMTEGWISFVQQLRLAIEWHCLRPRRTLYLNGSANPGRTAPIPALGVEKLMTASQGEIVTLDLPTGDRIKGRAWHRTNWQVGVTVPQWGDGLLIVTDKSVTDTSPDGRGMVVLTTYGLSDQEFAELEGRWRTWWDANFEAAKEQGCS